MDLMIFPDMGDLQCYFDQIKEYVKHTYTNNGWVHWQHLRPFHTGSCPLCQRVLDSGDDLKYWLVPVCSLCSCCNLHL